VLHSLFRASQSRKSAAGTPFPEKISLNGDGEPACHKSSSTDLPVTLLLAERDIGLMRSQGLNL